MKIMFYIDSLGAGGAQRVMSNLANYFCDQHYNVVFVTDYYQKPDDERYCLTKGIKRIYLRQNIEGNPISKNVQRVIILRKRIKDEKPDVILSFLGHPNIRMILASIGIKTKKIVSVRNAPDIEYDFMGKRKKSLVNLFFTMADGIVFQTEDAAKYFGDNIRKKSKIIFNPVADIFFETKREEETRNIVAIGRLSAQKNHMILIQAFAELSKEFPNEKLLIYGEGELKTELQKYINKLGMKERIFLMGNTTNVAPILAKAKLFVLSSDYEGMPNALMEAMAVGVPCISTDCPCGGPRALIHEQAGILTSVRDSIQLRESMRMLLTNSEKRLSYGMRAKERAKIFHTQKILSEWEEYIHIIYQDIEEESVE